MIAAPRVRPWHQSVLRELLRCNGMTAREIGDRLYRRSVPSNPQMREQVALHELLELLDMGLVDRDHMRPERWHVGLLAGEIVR